jgi:hypothetical protein
MTLTPPQVSIVSDTAELFHLSLNSCIDSVTNAALHRSVVSGVIDIAGDKISDFIAEYLGEFESLFEEAPVDELIDE